MNKEFANDVDNCLKTIQNQGIILYPTDTVWGLGCDATDEMAVQKIVELKNRPANKSFVVLVNTKEMLQKYVGDINEIMQQFLLQTQKPTTVVYPNAKGLAKTAIADDNSVAVRLCTEPFCNELISKMNKPLLSTSANISGNPTPRIFKEIEKEIVDGVNYVVNYRQNDERIASPSSIVKWENEAVKVLRP